MAFVIGDMVCTVMVLVGLSTILFMLLVPTLAEYRKGKGGSTRPMVIIVMAVLIVALVGYSTWLYVDYQEWMGTQELEYTLNVTMAEPVQGVLYLPVSVNTILQEALEVDSDNGSITIVETARGLALRLEFTGNVTVHAWLERPGDFLDFHLTMLDERHHETSRYHWVGLDTGGMPNGTVSVEFMLEQHSFDHDEWSWVSEEVDEGWESYKVHFEYYDWYYG